MRFGIIALTLVCACTSSGRSPRALMPAPKVFSLALASTSSGWAARCDTGCRWREAAFTCRIACDAIVDANGLRTAQAPSVEPVAFSFRVARADSGARAEASTGTAWRALSWSCDNTPCRVRITDHGVQVPAQF